MKKILSIVVVLCSYLTIVQSDASIYNLVMLNSTSALCLDGSPGAYYISEDGDPDKLFVYFEGGGWCGERDLNLTYESCYQRSKTGIGSSKQYPKAFSVTQGTFSHDQQNNFKDWKKILLMYCDGSGHQGTRKQPVQYKNTSLYFRGHNITTQQLQSLEQKLGLYSKAKQVVVSGGSAGGLAVYLWTNYIAQRVKNGKVWAVPDSGIFYDSYNVKQNRPLYKQGFLNLMKISNVQIDPPVPECVRQYPNAKQNCMFAQNIYKYIRVPIFPVQSLYDTWSIYNILGITCIGAGQSLANCNTTERFILQQYKQNVSRMIQDITSKKRNGVWAPACANHGYARNSGYYSMQFRIPQNSDNSVSKSIQNWLQGNGSDFIFMDQQSWPSNRPCSGLDRSYQYLNFFSKFSLWYKLYDYIFH